MHRIGHVSGHVGARPLLSCPAPSRSYPSTQPAAAAAAEYDLVIRGGLAYESAYPAGTAVDLPLKVRPPLRGAPRSGSPPY
jgi:hypothetical protein